MSSAPHTDPLKELDAVTARLREIEQERQQLRDRATDLVLTALRDKNPPTEVAGRSPFSPAHVRTLARENGIPPAPPGIKPRKRGRNQASDN